MILFSLVHDDSTQCGDILSDQSDDSLKERVEFSGTLANESPVNRISVVTILLSITKFIPDYRTHHLPFYRTLTSLDLQLQIIFYILKYKFLGFSQFYD